MGMITQLSNPARFLSVTRPVLPAAGVIALLCLGVGSWLAFFGSPPDFRQGESVRITGKNKDDLQLAIQLVKSKEDELDVPLQFENYR